jgi:hypothetical protein
VAIAIKDGLTLREDRHDLLTQNPVQKSYARPLFPVNEKCNLITQVWQNLALNDPLGS